MNEHDWQMMSPIEKEVISLLNSIRFATWMIAGVVLAAPFAIVILAMLGL